MWWSGLIGVHGYGGIFVVFLFLLQSSPKKPTPFRLFLSSLSSKKLLPLGCPFGSAFGSAQVGNWMSEIRDLIDRGGLDRGDGVVGCGSMGQVVGARLMLSW